MKQKPIDHFGKYKYPGLNYRDKGQKSCCTPGMVYRDRRRKPKSEIWCGYARAWQKRKELR